MEDDVFVTPLEIIPFKGKYMKIKRGENFLILDPNKYDISSLMMLLDISKLNKLESQFKKHQDGIEKDQFIKLMVNELPKDQDDLINLVYGLYKLFLEIDFNGDQKMQWEEFTQFIIDSVMGENDSKSQEDEDDVVGGKDTSEKHMIKYKRYNVSSLTDDRTLHDTDIIDCAYSNKIDKIFVVEYKSKKIKMYNQRTGRIDYSFDLDNYFKAPVKETSSMNSALDDSKSDKKKGMLDKKKKPKKEIKQQQLTFSVLSFCLSPGNICAICTTNKKILFFEFTPDGKEEFRYEITTPVLQKRVWFLPDHNAWLSTGMKKEEDKIFHLNELDIEFEYKNSKWEIMTNIGVKLDEKTINTNPFRGSIGDHTDEILDCIEIKKPMLVLTACMDKIIRLINLNDREIVEIWADQHKSAIRSLDYNANVGVGTILSVGFEYYINVWSPEVALNDAFKGKLEGHYSPVIMCKFLSGSPMCVSVDEEGNVRIWDARQLLCLQLIPQEKKNFKVSRLLNLHKHNRFVLYGNKMVFYDPKYRDSDIKPKNQKVDENYPIKVEFNKYYMTFYVCTTKDVRIYSCRNGELIKVFKNLRNNTNEQEAKIKYFSFEDRHRKFYLGFSHGAIQLFNAGNGSMIKRIGEYEEEKEGITQQRYDHSSEISNIFYEEDNQILITTGLDSLINIYSEEDPEESIKLRTLKGGHKIQERYNQILSFDFCQYLNLFATGSSDGLVTVWDFELSKVDEVLYLRNVDKDKVYDCLSLKFFAPFPILASMYSDGSIYLWGVRPSNKFRGDCFMRFRNSYMINNKIEHIPITTSIFVYGEMDEISVSKREYPIPKKEKLVPDNQVAQKTEEKNDKAKHHAKSHLSKRNTEFKQEEKKDIVAEPEQEITEIEIDDEKYDFELDRNRFDPPQRKSYFIIGDQKGLIRIFDIKPIVRKFKFEEAAQAHITSKFNIMKKDDINVEAIVSYYLQKDKKNYEKFFNVNPFLLVREFQAHDDSIININPIKDPFSFITCSKDKRFKIWTYQGECIGEVNIGSSILNSEAKQNCEWKFKIDWEKLKLEEMNEVMRIYSNVSGNSLSLKDENYTGENLITDENVDETKKKTVSKQELNIVRKKRYKPLEESKKDKILISYNDDADVKFDDQYIQELSKKIHRVVNPPPYETGLYEMGKHLFDSAFKKDKDRDLSENLNYLSPALNAYSNNRVTKEKKPTSKNKIREKELNNKLPNEKGIKYATIARDQLQSEKHFKSLSGVCKKRGDEFLLPLINDKKNQNIKFKKGETERYLAFEFYRNSYNNCFHSHGNDVSNETLRKNYATMWRYVQEYGKTTK